MAYINGKEIAFSPKLVQGGSGGIVDQTYNPKSENAQSGKAVAEAIRGISTDDCFKKPETISEDYAQIPAVTPINTTQYYNVEFNTIENSGEQDIPTSSAVKQYLQDKYFYDGYDLDRDFLSYSLTTGDIFNEVTHYEMGVNADDRDVAPNGTIVIPKGMSGIEFTAIKVKGLKSAAFVDLSEIYAEIDQRIKNYVDKVLGGGV